MAADSTMLRMVNLLMALSLGVHREQLLQRMGLTWPRPFLLRPLFFLFFTMIAVDSHEEGEGGRRGEVTVVMVVMVKTSWMKSREKAFGLFAFSALAGRIGNSTLAAKRATQHRAFQLYAPKSKGSCGLETLLSGDRPS